jgi:hypothetical protein
MNFTLAEKVAHFEKYFCGPIGLTASDLMVRKLEQIAKTNASETTMSCQDFNNAYLPTANLTSLDSLCTGTTNLTYSKFTKAPATAQAGSTLKTSSSLNIVTFQTLLATAFVSTGIASFLG